MFFYLFVTQKNVFVICFCLERKITRDLSAIYEEKFCGRAIVLKYVIKRYKEGTHILFILDKEIQI